jgi:DNA-binding NtrC family response regulator
VRNQGHGDNIMQAVHSKGIRLLLVDDEVGFAEVVSKRLRKRGMWVKAVFTGSNAIKAIRKQDFDVAVLDLKMEDMDGIEVLKIFKKAYPEMAVIMLTGHGSETAAKEGLKHGAFDYLTKPCDLEDLVEKIHEAVQ